jgi:hypothetical protein
MPIYRRRLKTTLSLIKRDLKEGRVDEWWYTTGTFVRFSSDVDQSSYREKKVRDVVLRSKCSTMHGHLRRIMDDLEILLSMLDQANWQTKMVKEGHLDTYHNMLYGGILADAFLTRYRSTYDTIAKAFKEIMSDPGHAPRLRFSVFRKLCNEKEKDCMQKFGKDLARLIQSCDWFDQIRYVRNGVVHCNFKTSGFMADRILFQVRKGYENQIDFPKAMVNKNLVDFELYAAVHIAYTLWLLEKFARMGYEILKPKKFRNSKKAEKGYDGLDVLKDSIERVLADQI